MLLTRSPLIQPNKSQVFSVRLACVKHAASVRPEPGSNSPNKNKNVKAQKNQPTKTRPASNPNQKHSKTKNRHKQNKQTHYRVHKQHPHDQAHTKTRMFSKGVLRHVSAISALRFVRCRSAQQGKQYALPSGPSNHDTHTSLSEPFRRIPPLSSRSCATNGPKSPDFMLQHTEYQTECALRREDFGPYQPATYTRTRTITFFAQNFTNR